MKKECERNFENRNFFALTAAGGRLLAAVFFFAGIGCEIAEWRPRAEEIYDK